MTVSGYKIYYAQVGQSLTNVWRVGNTNLTTITNLVSATNIIYRFTCVATNAAGLESPPTMELQSIIPPHAVKRPRFVGYTSTSITLFWQASDEADAKTYKVTYGTTNPYTTNTVTVGKTGSAAAFVAATSVGSAGRASVATTGVYSAWANVGTSDVDYATVTYSQTGTAATAGAARVTIVYKSFA